MAFKMTLSIPQYLVNHMSEEKQGKSMASYLTKLIKEDYQRKQDELAKEGVGE